MKNQSCLVSIVVLLSSCFNASGQIESSGWMQFRGSNGTGVYHGKVPLPSSLNDESLCWKVDAPAGHSSPIVVNDSVFITGYEPGKLSTLCFDLTTGQLRWRRDIDVEKFERTQAQHGPATPTPVSDGKRLFVVFGSLGIVAYDLQGEELWRHEREMKRNLFGSASSPIIADGRLVVFLGNQEESLLQAIDPESGDVIWNRRRPGPASSWSTPVIWQADLTSTLLVYEPFNMRCVSLQDGSDLWSVPNLADEPITVPMIEGSKIFTTSYNMRLNQEVLGLPTFETLLKECDADDDGMIDRKESEANKSVLSRPDADGQGDHPLSIFFRMLDSNEDQKIQADEYPRLKEWVDSFEHANGFIALQPGKLHSIPKLVWTHEPGVPECPSPIIYDGKLFAVRNGGVVTCLETETGNQLFQGRFAAGGPYYASIVGGDSKLFFASQRGQLTVLSADEKHEKLGSYDVGESIHATPALVPAGLVIRSKNHLWLFAAPQESDEAVKDSPQVVKDLEALKAELQKSLDQVVEEDELPGATLAVVLPDGQRVSLASGFEDVESRNAMPVNAQMLVGSTGKTFVSAVALQLVAEGKLGLDDEVSKFFQDDDQAWYSRIPNAETLTVRSLMNHTSGIPRYVFSRKFLSDLQENPQKQRSPRECVATILDAKPVHEVGEGWGYSDTNYLMLGMIIEKVTGNSFYEESHRRLLKPLRLEHTQPTTQAKLPGLIQGHAGQPNPFGIPEKTVKDGVYVINPSFEWCGGGYMSSVNDLATWMQALHSGEVLDADVYAELITPVDFRTGKESQQGYGLGTFVWQTELGEFVGHAGVMPGYLTQIEFSREHRFSVTFQMNTDVGSNRKNHNRVVDFAKIVVKHLNP